MSSVTLSHSPLIPTGITVKFGQQELAVHPLTRSMMKKYSQEFRRLEKGEFASTFDIVDFQCAVIADCLRMNYPELSQNELDAMIDSSNVALAWAALNSDFDQVADRKKTVNAFQSGNLIGMPTAPTSPI